MRWMCLLQLPGRSFMHLWSGSGAARMVWAMGPLSLPAECSLFTSPHNFSKISRTNTVEVLILATLFRRLQLCRCILISYIIIRYNWLDSGQSPLISYGCNWKRCLMLGILVAEQTHGEVRSAVRSQFDHLSQLHWTADSYPSGIILSVVLQ